MKKITIYAAGKSRGNPGSAAVGVQIVDARGTMIKEVSETIGNATNTFAEYFAVVRGLQTAKEVYGKSTKDIQVEVKLDSELVKKQLNGEYQIKEPGLVPFFIEIHNMRVASFPRLTFTHVRREFNTEADRLVNEALQENQQMREYGIKS
jgi:ribonuclease HI